MELGVWKGVQKIGGVYCSDWRYTLEGRRARNGAAGGGVLTERNVLGGVDVLWDGRGAWRGFRWRCRMKGL
jgi:hypothetical protein